MSFPRYPKYKSSGVEWLGDVPEHWNVKRFQRCVCVAEGQVDPENATYSGMSLIAPNHIESATGRLLRLETAGDQGAESGKYICKAGDVVYSKIRPALRKVCIAPEDCLCSADMYPLRSHSGLSNSFLFWLILSEEFSALAVLESQRVAMPKINRESLKAVMFSLPSQAEQTGIAGFLDRETLKIDSLVAEQRRLIELLKEKRQAVISHAVTKGLNPHAPTKPSGIEWLGDVPEHWDVVRIKHLTRSIKAGPFGSSLTKDTYVESGYRVYGQEQVIPNDFTIGDYYNSQNKFDELAQCSVSPGDILISCVGTFGKIAIVPESAEPGIINPRLLRLRCNAVAEARYFVEVLRSQVTFEQFSLFSRGGTMDVISIATLSDIVVPVPPVEEQSALTQFIHGEIEKFDALTAAAQRGIELLQERRTALISAAVTGKIDVRSLAAKEAA